MATAADVERAIGELTAKIAGTTPEPGMVPDRTILCVLPDLKVAYWLELKDGKLRGLRPAEETEVTDARITAKSDDLVGLLDGKLNVGMAFLMGKVRIDAAARDLMMLRKLF